MLTRVSLIKKKIITNIDEDTDKLESSYTSGNIVYRGVSFAKESDSSTKD